MTASRAIVIFGATGDLAQRMLFPALFFLEEDRLLPNVVAIIGCARSKADTAEFEGQVERAIRLRADHGFSEETWSRFRTRL